MEDLLRCKCEGSDPYDDNTWNNDFCTNTLGRAMEWCHRGANFYCNAGDMGMLFRDVCVSRGGVCKAIEC